MPSRPKGGSAASRVVKPVGTRLPAPSSSSTAKAGCPQEIPRETLAAKLYDIVPTMAAPQSTSINCLAVTPDLRYWFTGGGDGYIRKHDGVATINGKQLLTVAQRHPFVDSVTKAGVLLSYWGNHDPVTSALGPVYSLAAHSQAVWLLAGLESGRINMCTVRHAEGTSIGCLHSSGHKSAVSALTLAPDEKSVLSGGWDKTVLDWDLNTLKVIRRFEGSGAQISTIELRPAGGARDAAPPEVTWPGYDAGPVTEPASPAHESLFGSPAGGSLFGDDDEGATTALAGPTNDDPGSPTIVVRIDPPTPPAAMTQPSQDLEPAVLAQNDDSNTSSYTTFLATSIDGTIRVWDRRAPRPVALIDNRPGVPPWCLGACWSPDGNTIYTGRRNNTVEEFSVFHAQRGWMPERVLKLPPASGPVSCVRAMVNGRHLICASHDILRLYDLREAAAFKNSAVPYMVIPGPPKAGIISCLYIDPSSRFMVTTGGTRGWDGTSTEVMIGYEIGVVE